MAESFFRELDHPADLCLAVWGASRAELFCHAAQALFQTLEFTIAEPSASATCAITLNAPDAETLMVDWLSELVYQSGRQRAVWQRFEINEMSATRLQAQVHGQGPAQPRREVKAVTYAGLEVEQQQDGRWSVTITFDV